MRKYIINLTNNLIRKNGYHRTMKKRGVVIHLREHIKLDLLNRDVAKMKPETLGKILSQLEIGDVMISKQNFFSSLQFSGDMEELLREQVALSLACVIKERLYQDITNFHIPPFLN